MHQRRLHSLVPALAFAVAPLLASSAADAAPQRRVGIVTTVAVNLTADEATQLGVELAAALTKALPVDVLAGDDVARRLPPAGLPSECISDPECRNDLGRRLDADELLVLVMVKLGDTTQIDATWANIATGETKARPRIELGAGKNRAEIFAAAAPKLLPHIRKEEKAGPAVIVVNAGNAGNQNADDSGRRITPPVWIAASVAGASLIGSGIFALSTREKFSSLDDDGCRQMECGDARIKTGRRHALYADILFGVGAAALVTSAVFYALSAPDGEPEAAGEKPSIGVTATESSLGLSVGGSF